MLQHRQRMAAQNEFFLSEFLALRKVFAVPGVLKIVEQASRKFGLRF
jgi:hypothetical protein